VSDKVSTVYYKSAFLVLKKKKEAYEITSLSLCVCLPHPQLLKAGIVEPEEVAIVRKQIGEHISTAINTDGTLEELLGCVFSMQSMSCREWEVGN
jgi:hypothetical protein